MYPTDDRLIRIRLLIKQSQEARARMMKRIAESRALRARAAQRLERPQSATGTRLKDDTHEQRTPLESGGGGGEQ
jgi:hypothetical protein